MYSVLLWLFTVSMRRKGVWHAAGRGTTFYRLFHVLNFLLSFGSPWMQLPQCQYHEEGEGKNEILKYSSLIDLKSLLEHF